MTAARDPRSVPDDDPPPPLGRWLLDRIAEDEALARGAEGGKGPYGYFAVQGWAYYDADFGDLLPSKLVNDSNAWSPARVLAEVAAKRRIVELHTPKDPPGLHLCPVCVSWEIWRSQEPGESLPLDDAPCETLRLVALPYADHPTYRTEWRP